MSTDILTELYLDDAWTPVPVYTRDSIGVTRGKANEGSQSAPSSCSLTLDNRSGDFATRNPLSPYFGQLGRNTRLRVSRLGGPEGSLALDDTSTGYASTPDAASLDITGDIDLRVEIRTDTLANPVSPQNLLSKGSGTAAQMSYALDLYPLNDGTLQLSWSANGSTVLFASAFGIGPLAAGERIALRATLDVNNGASGKTARFYYSDSLEGTWTQIGVDQITAGTTSIFNSTSTLRVGLSHAASPAHGLSGAVYAAEVRNGIGGTVVANPDFRGLAAGTTSFADTATPAKTWTVNSPAVVERRSYRFVGEVSSFPPKWTPNNADSWVSIEGAGLLRRLGQGTAPAASGLRDYILSEPDPLAVYFPLSGGEGTTYSLDIGGADTLRSKFYGQSIPGQIPVFKYGVDMGAAWLGTGMEINATGSAYMRGDVGTQANVDVAFDMVFRAVPPGLGVLTVQIQDYSGNMWNVVLNTEDDDGTLQVSFDDPAVGPIGFSATGQLSELQDTSLHHLRFQLTTDGADTDYAVYIDGASVKTGTMSGYTQNGCSLFRLFYTRYVNQTVMNVAHLALWSTSGGAVIPAIADVVAAAFGYTGETAGDRIERVAGLAGIPVVIVGDNDETIAMGAQYAEPTLSQIRDAENADLGILTEPRDRFGLLYRTRASIYNQDPAVTLDYSAGHLSPPFEPIDDDQQTRNDVTATRRDGDSYNVTQTTGPLSIQDPPVGVGRYQDETQVNVETDAMLPGVAQWLLNIGTLDQARYPSVPVNLAAPDVASDPDLVAALLGTDVGDLIRITGLDAVGIYDDVDLIVLGYPEDIGPVEHTITFNCMPAAPYQVAEWATSSTVGDFHWDTDGSELNAGITSSATSFAVKRSTGATSLWTTDADAFPFDIYVGGERMTVTAISSATSPQTFTVTRSVNGVVKAHDAGTDVRLFDTPRWAL